MLLYALWTMGFDLAVRLNTLEFSIGFSLKTLRSGKKLSGDLKIKYV